MDEALGKDNKNPYKRYDLLILLFVNALTISVLNYFFNDNGLLWVGIFLVLLILGLIGRGMKSDELKAKSSPNHPFSDLSSDKDSAKKWSKTEDLCLDCGQQIEIGKDFCTNCGNTLSDRIATNCTSREIVFNKAWISQLRTTDGKLFYSWWNDISDEFTWVTESVLIEKTSSENDRSL